MLLIDGIRLNNAVFREGPNQYWSTVDPLTIDRLEVVRGPSSVLYGSDAIGGTVNVLTRGRQPGADGDGFAWDRRLYYRYASAERSHTGRGELSASYDRVGMLGGISYRDFGDLSGGRSSGVQRGTGYDGIDGDFKSIFRLSENVDLVLAYQSVTINEAPRSHSTVFGQSFRGTTVGSDRRRDLDQRRQLGYAQVHWRPEEVDWLDRVTGSLSYHGQREEQFRVRSDGRDQRQGFDDDTIGAWVQLESPSPIGTLTYGLEHYHDEVSSFARQINTDGTISTRPRGPIADDSSYDLFGVYVQDSFRPVDPLEIILGGRFNFAHVDANVVDPDPTDTDVIGPVDDDFAGAVGSVRFIYEALDVWNVFGGVSQGFRAPNLSDLTRFDVARSGELETPSPDLESEDFVSLEIGSKVFLEDAGVEGYASYHYTFIDGMIVRFPTGAVIDGTPEVTKDNLGNGFVHGVELGASWHIGSGVSTFGHLGVDRG